MSQATASKACFKCNGSIFCPKCGYCIRCWPLHGDGYAGALYEALGTVEYLSSSFHFKSHKAVYALLNVAHLALEQVLSLTKHDAVDGLPPQSRAE